MKYFCDYCGTQIFENDRNCPKCGAPVTVLKTIRRNIDAIDEKYSKESKSFISSIADCSGWSYTDESLLFTGKTLLNKSIIAKNQQLANIYYHKMDYDIDIQEVDWKINKENFPNIFKLVLQIQTYKNDLIGSCQIIFPRVVASMDTMDYLKTRPLSVRNEDGADCYGYSKLIYDEFLQ